jgi:hypothetical protein
VAVGIEDVEGGVDSWARVLTARVRESAGMSASERGSFTLQLLYVGVGVVSTRMERVVERVVIAGFRQTYDEKTSCALLAVER